MTPPAPLPISNPYLIDTKLLFEHDKLQLFKCIFSHLHCMYTNTHNVYHLSQKVFIFLQQPGWPFRRRTFSVKNWNAASLRIEFLPLEKQFITSSVWKVSSRFCNIIVKIAFKMSLTMWVGADDKSEHLQRWYTAGRDSSVTRGWVAPAGGCWLRDGNHVRPPSPRSWKGIILVWGTQEYYFFSFLLFYLVAHFKKKYNQTYSQFN